MSAASVPSYERCRTALGRVTQIGLGRKSACVWASILLLTVGSPVHAQRVWVEGGPGPITQGQVENITDLEVIGAIHTVAPHPTNANIVYVGAVNGGVWMTTNATAASPSWGNQFGFDESQSIGALEFDPTDATSQTLVAGIGRFSNFYRRGGDRAGLARTTDGGANWAVIDGGGTLDGLNISGVAPRGATIVISVNTADILVNRGVWRSTNTGATWTQISGGGGTGLPAGTAYDLVGDPSNNAVLYTNAGSNGVYRSTNTGATWALVSDATMNALISGTTNNIQIAVGTSNNVYVGVVNGGQLAGVFRSGNGGTTWTQLDLPTTVEAGVNEGIHWGEQGNVNFSIAADPTNPNLVYVGGDVQPDPLPNSLGAANYTGRLFRGDASQLAGTQWVHLTHSNALGAAGGGTANSSAPHADSRDMAIDVNGDLIEVDDGGVYRRTNPQTNAGDWFSMNGDINVTEFHDVAWDANSNIVIGGAQDTGTPEQLLPTNSRWQSVSTADGGDVAVDDKSTPGLAIRYSSAQMLWGFRRRIYDASNTFVSEVYPALTVLGGGNPVVGQFATPIELNNVDPTRLIIGGGSWWRAADATWVIGSVYESLDQGDNVTEIGPGIVVNSQGRDPIAYGAVGNPDMLYVGSGDDVFVRTAAAPAALNSSATYPGIGTNRNVVDIAIDPDDPPTAYVADRDHVYQTTDAGATWTDITGDLQAQDPGTVRSIAYSTSNADGSVVVGSDNGVFIARGPAFTTWNALGLGFPRAPVYDLEYDAADEILVAGTLGRGAWTVNLSERDPVDVMLVLDLSGSMLSAACPGCDSKLNVLKEAVEIFVQLWKALARPDDRLGVNYFRTTISEFKVGSSVLLPVVANAPAMITDIRGQTTFGSNLTAMGGGLQMAIDTLDDDTRLRSIILFTDGMQNVNPMVRYIREPPLRFFHLDIDDDPAVSANSGVPPTTPPTRLDLALDRRINTIAVGATDSWVALLNNIANKTDGLHKATTAPDEDLRRFYVEELVDALRGGSPQLVDYRVASLAPNSAEERFSINSSATKLVLKLSWDPGQDMGIRVTKDGHDLTEIGQLISGPFYRLWVLEFPARLRGNAIVAQGEWVMRISGKAGAKYEAAAIVDEAVLNYEFTLAEQPYRVGDSLRLNVSISMGESPVTDARVSAQVLKPSTSIGTLLSTTPTPSLAQAQSEPGATEAQRMLQLLLQDETSWSALQPRANPVTLRNNGDGSYSSTWGGTTVPGSYRVVFFVEGVNSLTGEYRRTETVSALVEFAEAELSATEVRLLGPAGTDGSASLVLRPRDRYGNYLGPDYGHQIQVTVSPGTAATPGDLLDGRYRIALSGVNPQSTVQVSVMGRPLLEAKLAALAGYRWALSAHAGLTRPLGSFNNQVDGQLLVEVDFEYMVLSQLSVNTVLGLYRFDPDFDILGGTLYLRGYLPLNSFRLFGELGGGVYDPENLDLSPGLSAGVGLDHALGASWRAEIGGGFFHLLNEGQDIEFVTAKIGLRRTF